MTGKTRDKVDGLRELYRLAWRNGDSHKATICYDLARNDIASLTALLTEALDYAPPDLAKRIAEALNRPSRFSP